MEARNTRGHDGLSGDAEPPAAPAARTPAPCPPPFGPSVRQQRPVGSGTTGDARAVDTITLEVADQLLNGVERLIVTLRDGRSAAVEPVGQSVELARLVEALTFGLVGRARAGRVRWKDLGVALAMSPEHARRTYRKAAICRRLLSVPRPDRACARDRAALSGVLTGDAAALGQVLSGLQRTSGVPEQVLAQRLGVTTEDLHAVLSGEVFPALPLTERFARACGADAEVLRKIWEDERRR